MKINNNNYFSVQAWMVNQLNLRTVERDVFAIIYGYSQDEESDFHGSLEYMSQLTGYSRNSICTALKSLTEKHYIIKTEKVVNNIKYCRYRTSSLYAVQRACIEKDENVAESVQVDCINNKAIVKKENNKKENKDICKKFEFGHTKTTITVSSKEAETFKDLYNEHCSNLPKVVKLTDKRIKAVNHIIKNYSYEDIIKVFDSANETSFLLGNNDTGWKADFDFILREDKFINILEGKYSGKKKKRFEHEGKCMPITEDEKKKMKEFHEELRKNGKQVIF